MTEKFKTPWGAWDAEEMIRDHIRKSPKFKTTVLNRVKMTAWSGWASSNFVAWSKHATKAMEQMIARGEIIYFPGKPLKLREED